MDLATLKIHHIGYLVKNIDKSKSLFESMGYVVERDTVYDEFRNVDICFLVKDNYRIELVSPRTSNSVVGELRKKIGNSPYHICYEVENLKSSIENFKEYHFIIWKEAHSAPAIDNRKVAFLINGQIGMIELIEKNSHLSKKTVTINNIVNEKIYTSNHTMANSRYRFYIYDIYICLWI